MKIGIFPGTFDPLHRGHIEFALAAARDCGLDEVIFLPEHSPRRKTGTSPLNQRISQIEEQIKNHPGLRVARLKSKQFTVAKTLPELRLLGGNQMTLLVGSDVAANLHFWPGLDELLNEMNLAVGLRGEQTAEEIEQLIAGLGAEYRVIETEHKDVSSSQIRLELAKVPGL